jgi:hypothetical protein
VPQLGSAYSIPKQPSSTSPAPPSPPLPVPLFSLPRILDILRTGLLILRAEESPTVPREPGAELADLLAQPVHRLGVHVGLRDELGEVDCVDVSKEEKRGGTKEQTKHATEVLGSVDVAGAFAFPLRVFAGFPEVADL